MAIVIEEEEFERIVPFVTWILIGVNVLVFILEVYNPWIVDRFSFVPARFFEGRNIETIITHMFLHGSILHLVANMYFLWVFCDDLENVYGHVYFILFYIASGIGAALIYALLSPYPDIGCIGASGAVFGAMAAYIVFFPNRRLIIIMRYGYVKVKAWKFAVFYAAVETLFVILRIVDGIAHTAHVGGFMAGLALGYTYKVLAKPRIYKTPQKPW